MPSFNFNAIKSNRDIVYLDKPVFASLHTGKRSLRKYFINGWNVLSGRMAFELITLLHGLPRRLHLLAMTMFRYSSNLLTLPSICSVIANEMKQSSF